MNSSKIHRIPIHSRTVQRLKLHLLVVAKLDIDVGVAVDVATA